MNASSAEEQVRQAERDWITVYLANDAQALDGMLTDDFRYTSPAGEHVGRATYLSNLENDVVHMSRIDAADLVVTLHAQDQAAIVTGTWNVAERYRDTHADGEFRLTRVWIRDGQRWKAAVFQVTAVQAAPE